MHQRLNTSPPRVQITYRDEGLKDSKSDSQVSKSANRSLFRRSRSATGGLSSIALPQRRRGSAEDPHELKITAALNNSSERKKTPTITPTNTPPSEPEDDINIFENALDQLLESYGGSQSPQAKLLCLALSISDSDKRKIINQEQAYTYLQNRIVEFTGQALIISISLNSKDIANLLNALESKKIEKDYGCIVIAVSDSSSIESLNQSINKLMNTSISSDGIMVIFDSSYGEYIKTLNFDFDSAQKYDHLGMPQCALSKINHMTQEHDNVLILSSEEYEKLLEKELKKNSKKDYNPSKFTTFTTSQNNTPIPPDEILAQQITDKVLGPITKLISQYQPTISSIGI